MNGGLQLASLLGSMALTGFGLLPWLHRPDHTLVWLRVEWPRNVDEAAALALLRHLASSRRPAVVCFEAHARRGQVTHYVGVPVEEIERLRHLFRSFLADVSLVEAERPTPGLTTAAELRVGSRERALRSDSAVEVSRSVISALAGTHGSSILQWTLQDRLTPSHVPTDSLGLPSTGRLLTQAVTHGLAPLDAKARSDLQAKIGERGFRATLRVANSARDATVARGNVGALIAGLRVGEAPGTPLNARTTNTKHVIAPARAWRSGMAINVGELLGLLGWPLGDGEFPGITRARSKRLPVPTAVPSVGRVIGVGTHPSTERPVAQPASDLTTSMLLLGPTGTGKSHLMADLIVQDITAGRSCIVIDPKGGDLLNTVLERIPTQRHGDIVVLDANDERPVGLNPLAGRSPESAADTVIAILKGIFGDNLGPRSTDIIYAAVFTLAGSPNGTLAAIPRLLTDDTFRRSIIPSVTDPGVREFWRWYERDLSPKERPSVLAPAMNKLRVLGRPALRGVLNQATPKFDITDVFTKHKVLLVALDQHVLGSEGLGIFSSLVVEAAWRAALTRSKVPEAERSPVCIYLDEWQTMTHGLTDLADVLARSRSYGTGWCLANQGLSQLPPAVRSAALTNARSRVVFKVGADDASLLARTTSHLDAIDFQELGRYEIFASLVIDREAQAFCSAITRDLPAPCSNPNLIRATSQKRYGAAPDPIATTDHDHHDGPDGETTTGSSTSIGSKKRRSRADREGGEPR